MHILPKILFLLATSLSSLLLVAQADLVWPTPNPAFQKGEPIEAFVQPTVSGKIESGLFGCVRNEGHRFHEGLDLFPIARDKRGEATDAIYAVLPGRIVHINKVAAHSSYGRYIVIQHDGEDSAFHTLYAHLASVDPAISVGKQVSAGRVIGVMGRSASTPIPKSRAHLHFEIGVRLTDNFQAWYDRQKLSSKNRHGNWNGMNLVSVDPLDFYQKVRSGKVSGFGEYLMQLPTYASIRIFTTSIPDFVKRYPMLVTCSYEPSDVVAWDISFTQFGIPKEWVPRFASEGLEGKPGDVAILAYNPEQLKKQTCRRVLDLESSGPKVTKSTLITLKKIFGFE